MRPFFVLLIFLFGINVVFAADISQVVFVSEPQTIEPGQISEKLTVQTQDAAGNSLALGQTACLELSTSSNSGEFSSSDTNWSSVNILTMNKGWANRNFYYKDDSAGNFILTAKLALRPEAESRSCSNWPVEEWDIQWSANQDIFVSGGAGQQSQQSAPSASAGESVGFIEDFGKIYGDAGGDKFAVAGADIKFSGQGYGINKEPLEKARYFWSFGDGATADGQNVLHHYKYTGDYVAVLQVVSGKYSASDYINVRVEPNQLKICEANIGYIRLCNNSKKDLDISGWFVRYAGTSFVFPQFSVVKDRTSMPLASSVSGISLPASGAVVELLYPNGSVADIFQNNGQIAQPAASYQTVSKQLPVVETGIKDGEENIEEDDASGSQLAGVAYPAEKNPRGLNKWLMITLAMGIAGGVGFLLTRDRIKA